MELSGFHILTVSPAPYLPRRSASLSPRGVDRSPKFEMGVSPGEAWDREPFLGLSLMASIAPPPPFLSKTRASSLRQRCRSSTKLG